MAHCFVSTGFVRPLILLVLLPFAGCGGGVGGIVEEGQQRTWPSDWSLLQMIEGGASVLWAAPHPDDESIAGSLLALACRGLGNPCTFVLLTHGEGGKCYAPPCPPDMGALRSQEMEASARAFSAELVWGAFTNFPTPIPPVEEVRLHWEEEGDPVGFLVETIRRYRPDVVLGLDASFGFTGHNEHRLTGLLVQEAFQLSGDPSHAAGGLPAFRPPRNYTVINRYWFMFPLGWDDGPVDETFDTGCAGNGRSCLEEAAEALSAHQSQWTWIVGATLLGEVGGGMLLKRVDGS